MFVHDVMLVHEVMLVRDCRRTNYSTANQELYVILHSVLKSSYWYILLE